MGPRAGLDDYKTQNPLAPARIRALVCPVRSLVAIPTELTGFVTSVSALHVKKSVGTLVKVSRVCCSSLSSVVGLDW